MLPISRDIHSTPPFRSFIQDMAALGVTPVTRGGLPYAVVAARSNPRWWLLPLDNRRAAASGLEMLQPVTPLAKLAKASARAVARFGPHSLLGNGSLRLSGLPDFCDAFGGRAAHVAYFTGTAGPHRKTALQVMDANGAILGYAKLSRTPHIRPYISHEAKILARVAALGLQSAAIPRVLALRDDPDITLLVTDSHKSRHVITPLQPGFLHMHWLDELRSRTTQTGAAPLLEALAGRLSVMETVVAGPNWACRITKALGALHSVADDIELCLVHGDFTPWNSFVQGDQLHVFDWEYANPSWPVGFDLAHFMLATIPLDQQPDRVPDLLNRISHAHFGGNKMVAWRALLLSLSCHAVFYLGRLLEVGSPLSDWIEGQARAAMLDRLLAQRDTLT